MAGLPIAVAFGDDKAWCPIKVVGPCIAAPIAVVIAVSKAVIGKIKSQRVSNTSVDLCLARFTVLGLLRD